MRFLRPLLALFFLTAASPWLRSAGPTPAEIEAFTGEVDGALVMAGISGDKEHREPLEHATRWITRYPESAVGYNKRGEILLLRAEYDRASTDFAKAIALDGGYALAYSNRARAHALKGDPAAAFADLNRALELNPKDAESFTNRARLHFQGGAYDLAFADCNRAIELAGAAKDHLNLADALRMRGATHAWNGNRAAAIADYSASLEHELDHPGAKEALANLRKSPAGDPQASLQAGTQKLQQKDLDGAIAAFNDAVSLAPNDPAGYDGRGRAYALKRELEKAVQDFTKLIELTPNDASAYLKRGGTYSQLRQKALAVADLREALRLRPDLKQAAQMLKLLGETP